MATQIYFVRHAPSRYTPDELNRPLTEEGFSLARSVTDLLKEEHVDLVYSSPYKRAIQTIEGTANYFNKPILVEDAFRERQLSEAPVDDFESVIRKLWQEEGFSYTGGESNLEAQKRGVKALKEILKKAPNQRSVIGTHGNIMVLMMRYFDKQFDYSFWKTLDMPDIYLLNFEGENLLGVKRLWIPLEVNHGD